MVDGEPTFVPEYCSEALLTFTQVIDKQLDYLTKDPNAYPGLTIEKILEVASSKDQNKIDIWMANYYLNILPIRLEIISEQLEKLFDAQMEALMAYHNSMMEEY